MPGFSDALASPEERNYVFQIITVLVWKTTTPQALLLKHWSGSCRSSYHFEVVEYEWDLIHPSNLVYQFEMWLLYRYFPLLYEPHA